MDADTSNTPSTGSQPVCGLGRRLAAAAYDAVVILALLMLAGLIALPLGGAGQQALRDPAYTAYLMAVWFVYLAWCWRRGGMTLGMRAWRIRLATGDGAPPGWGACLARFIGALLGAAALGAGWLWCLIDRNRLCWHDRLSGTHPVRDPRRSGSAAQDQDRHPGQ